MPIIQVMPTPDEVDRVIKAVSGKAPRYVRAGQCIRCGSCCELEDCPHFDHGDGVSTTCKIHDRPDFPEKCRLYPDNPPTIFKKCGFYFVDTLDDNRKLKVREV
jgi:hypothetical protein